jgi:hypothetical protein
MAIVITYATWYNYGTNYVLTGVEADNTGHLLAIVQPELWQTMAVDKSVDDSGSSDSYGGGMTATKASIDAAGIWDVTTYGPPG